MNGKSSEAKKPMNSEKICLQRFYVMYLIVTIDVMLDNPIGVNMMVQKKVIDFSVICFCDDAIKLKADFMFDLITALTDVEKMSLFKKT